MKILHLDSGDTKRGGQLQLERLIDGLSSRGFEQTLLARGELAASRSVRRLTPTSLLKESSRADLIHAHDAHSHTLAALLGRGKPLVVSRRVAFPIRSGRMSKWKYSQPERYIAVSESVREVLTDYGVPGDRVEVVYDGIELPDAPPPLGLRNSPPKVAVLGSADPLKRTDEALEACRRASLVAVCDADLERALEASDVFLYLPVIEGLGSAILAAGVRGIPIVAADKGGIGEIVDHEKTGLLTDGSAKDAAAALRRIADDPDLGRRLAHACYASIEQRFASDIMVNRTAEIYRSLVR